MRLLNKLRFLDKPVVEETPWYDGPDARERIERNSIGPGLKRHALDFIEHGFVVFEGAISADAVARARAEFVSWRARNATELVQFEEPDKHLVRIVNLHATLPALCELFSTNPALALQDYLLGAETVLYTSLFFERGSAQPIHRDIPYFWTNPSNRYFGMWVALEDVDLENGPLEVMVGGHKLPSIARDTIGRRHFPDPNSIPKTSDALWYAYQNEVMTSCERLGLKRKPVLVSKGDTILWHPMLPHGGAAVRDFTRTRLSFVMHNVPRDTPVYQGDVFFDPAKRVPRRADWKYRLDRGRHVALSGPMAIGHGRNYDFSKLT